MSEKRLEAERIWDFVQRRRVAVLATAIAGEPQACTIFYVCRAPYLYFKSRTASAHGHALRSGAHDVALAIYEHESTYEHKAGVQLHGRASRVLDVSKMSEVVALYSQAFDGAAARFAPISIETI